MTVRRLDAASVQTLVAWIQQPASTAISIRGVERGDWDRVCSAIPDAFWELKSDSDAKKAAKSDSDGKETVPQVLILQRLGVPCVLAAIKHLSTSLRRDPVFDPGLMLLSVCSQAPTSEALRPPHRPM